MRNSITLAIFFFGVWSIYKTYSKKIVTGKTTRSLNPLSKQMRFPASEALYERRSKASPWKPRVGKTPRAAWSKDHATKRAIVSLTTSHTSWPFRFSYDNCSTISKLKEPEDNFQKHIPKNKQVMGRSHQPFHG